MWELLAELASWLWAGWTRKAMLGGALGGLTPFLIFYTIGKYFLPPVWAESGEVAILLVATCLPAGLIGAIVGGIIGLPLTALFMQPHELAQPRESNWGFVIGYIGGLIPWVIFAFWAGII